MLKNNVNCNSPQRWTSTLLFLLFLAFFSIYPIAESYADYLCPPSVLYDPNDPDADNIATINDLKLDGNRNFFIDLKTSKDTAKDHHGFKQAAIKSESARHISTIPILTTVKPSQGFLPASSDLSPPVA